MLEDYLRLRLRDRLLASIRGAVERGRGGGLAARCRRDAGRHPAQGARPSTPIRSSGGDHRLLRRCGQHPDEPGSRRDSGRAGHHRRGLDGGTAPAAGDRGATRAGVDGQGHRSGHSARRRPAVGSGRAVAGGGDQAHPAQPQPPHRAAARDRTSGRPPHRAGPTSWPTRSRTRSEPPPGNWRRSGGGGPARSRPTSTRSFSPGGRRRPRWPTSSTGPPPPSTGFARWTRTRLRGCE